MFSAGPNGAWSQEASHAREAENGTASSDLPSPLEAENGTASSHAVRAWSQAVRPLTTKQELALRKKMERAHTSKLLARLEFLAPRLDENKGQPGGGRSKALRGRAKEELLKDVVDVVRQVHGLRGEDIVLEESE